MALDCYRRADGTTRTRTILLPPPDLEAAGAAQLAVARAVPEGAIWYPGALRQLLPSDVGGQLTEVRGLVLHVQQGRNNPWAWFDRPDVDASSHWWVSKTGMVAQYVPANRVAWAQRSGNPFWHSVETEGFDSEPLTDRQVEALAALYRWGAGHWGWAWELASVPSGRGLGTHQMGGTAWGGHACPGTIRAGQRAEILALAQGSQPLPPAAEEEDDMDAVELRTVLNEGTGNGQTSWAGTSRATLAAAQEAVNSARAARDVAARVEQLLAGGGTTTGLLSMPDVLAAVGRAGTGDVPYLLQIVQATATRLAELVPTTPSEVSP